MSSRETKKKQFTERWLQTSAHQRTTFLDPNTKNTSAATRTRKTDQNGGSADRNGHTWSDSFLGHEVGQRHHTLRENTIDSHKTPQCKLAQGAESLQRSEHTPSMAWMSQKAAEASLQLHTDLPKCSWVFLVFFEGRQSVIVPPALNSSPPARAPQHGCSSPVWCSTATCCDLPPSWFSFPPEGLRRGFRGGVCPVSEESKSSVVLSRSSLSLSPSPC